MDRLEFSSLRVVFLWGVPTFIDFLEKLDLHVVKSNMDLSMRELCRRCGMWRWVTLRSGSDNLAQASF